MRFEFIVRKSGSTTPAGNEAVIAPLSAIRKTLSQLSSRHPAPSAEAEAQWVAHHDEVANMTLIPRTDSWYMGANIEGKRRSLLAYAGGVGVYKQLCDEVKAKEYAGLELA